MENQRYFLQRQTPIHIVIVSKIKMVLLTTFSIYFSLQLRIPALSVYRSVTIITKDQLYSVVCSEVFVFVVWCLFNVSCKVVRCRQSHYLVITILQNITSTSQWCWTTGHQEIFLHQTTSQCLPLLSILRLYQPVISDQDQF